ncbi:MAG: hypothetical protein FWD06_00405 [Oscillospiraceae bacterium]|nr:hypothetical protein [Oscillospiraceae bacterium]
MSRTLQPKMLERMLDQLDEMRILLMLEQSERDIATGNVIPFEEGFARLRASLAQYEDDENEV